MRKFLKATLLVLLTVCSVGVLAQKYGVELGYNQPVRFGSQFKTDYFDGIRLGGNVEFELKNNLSLLTGTLYSLVYSSNTQYYSSTDSINYKTIGHSLEIPVQIQYSIPVSKNFKFIAFAGPQLGIGITQPQKVTAVISSAKKTEIESITPDNMKPFVRTTSVGYADNDLYVKSVISRINFQITLGGGVQYKNYRLKAGYDFGINSINKVDTSNLLRQSGWFASLVYQF